MRLVIWVVTYDFLGRSGNIVSDNTGHGSGPYNSEDEQYEDLEYYGTHFRSIFCREPTLTMHY